MNDAQPPFDTFHSTRVSVAPHSFRGGFAKKCFLPKRGMPAITLCRAHPIWGTAVITLCLLHPVWGTAVITLYLLHPVWRTAVITLCLLHPVWGTAVITLCLLHPVWGTAVITLCLLHPVWGTRVISLCHLQPKCGEEDYFSKSGRKRLVRSMACSNSHWRILASLPLSKISGTCHPL